MMRELSVLRRRAQSGFTLIELVLVVVIIGILAAVAIPNLGNPADDARKTKVCATLGALKGAWSMAYASTRTAPGCQAIGAAIPDPDCTKGSGASIKCAGVTTADGTTLATFTCKDATTVASPADISTTDGESSCNSGGNN